MCLAVPGKLIAVQDAPDPPEQRVGTVDFQGSRLDVGLAFTPEAAVGDWLLVHAGFALSVLDAEEARETWAYLAEAAVVDDLPAELKALPTDASPTNASTGRGAS